MKGFLALFFLTVIQTAAFAQTANHAVVGSVKDSISKYPLADATVSVVAGKDSALVSFTLTSRGGGFEFRGLSAGLYELVVSYEGLQTKRLAFTVSNEERKLDLGVIEMVPQYKTMQEVVVSNDAPVRIKGDTIAFKADAFKTKPDAVAEDLLKKLPGVQVDRNGTVTAMGEEVQKIYVDGKEFFGNDPKMATKNITADMIDQVEIYDDASEQSKFNKIDDGSKSKAINLKLKKDRKRGVFGKVYAGYGTDDRYDAGANAYFFKNAMQTAVVARSNNINEIGFTGKDLAAGSGSAVNARDPNSARGGFSPNMAPPPGIIGSSQAGANYKNLWGSKVDFSGSYLFSSLQTNNTEELFRQTFGSNLTTYSEQLRVTSNHTASHTSGFNLTWFADSFNSVSFYPTLALQRITNQSSDTTSLYNLDAPGGKREINQGRQVSNSSTDAVNWVNNLIWRKKFRRVGRTLSVTYSNTANGSDRETYNIFAAKVNSRNTYVDNSGKVRNYSAGFSYTEPLARNKMVELNYSYANNQSESDRDARLYNPVTNMYDIIDQRQTNAFQNASELHRVGANYRFYERNYNYQIGFAVSYSQLQSDNLSKNTSLKQNFKNLFPVALFNYQFRGNRSLRVAYRGSTRQPSISQLQEVTDETNAPYYYRGNASLKQEFTSDVRVTYNVFNLSKMQTMFGTVTVRTTHHQISNSVKDTTGGQLTVPVNLNGYYAVLGTLTFSFPVQAIKGTTVNTTTRLLLNRQPTLFNGEKIYTRTLGLGEDLRLNYSPAEKLDLGVALGVSYNYVAPSAAVSKQQKESYFINTASVELNYELPRRMIIDSDVDLILNTGRTAGYNARMVLWNLSLSKPVLESGELKLSVNDLLNQNTGINRNAAAGYIEDVRSVVLKRYVLLRFTWKISKMGTKKRSGI